jgi:hypothetical protein
MHADRTASVSNGGSVLLAARAVRLNTGAAAVPAAPVPASPPAPEAVPNKLAAVLLRSTLTIVTAVAARHTTRAGRAGVPNEHAVCLLALQAGHRAQRGRKRWENPLAGAPLVAACWKAVREGVVTEVVTPETCG